MKTIYIASIIFGIVVAIMLGVGSLSVFETFEDNRTGCIFPQGGGVCEFDVTLQEDKIFTSYEIDMSFEGEPNSQFIERTQIEPLDVYDYVYDKYVRYGIRSKRYEPYAYEVYLYKLPNDYLDNRIYELKIERETHWANSLEDNPETYNTGKGIFDSPEMNIGGGSYSRYYDGDWFKVRMYHIPTEYNDDKVVVCYQPTTRCSSNTIFEVYGDELADFTSIDGNYIEFREDLVSFEDPYPYILDESDFNVSDYEDFAFIVTELSQSTCIKTDDGVCDPKYDFGKSSETYVSMRPYKFPSNITYGSETQVSGTLMGEQSDPLTLDISSVINNQCTDIEGECTATIMFESESLGTMFIDDSRFELGEASQGIDVFEPIFSPFEPIGDYVIPGESGKTTNTIVGILSLFATILAITFGVVYLIKRLNKEE